MHSVPSGYEKMMLLVVALLSTGRLILRYCFRGINWRHLSRLAWPRGTAIIEVESLKTLRTIGPCCASLTGLLAKLEDFLVNYRELSGEQYRVIGV